MAADPAPKEIDRLVAAAEAALRRLGFGERTIRDRRQSTRAQIVAHLSEGTHNASR